MSNLPKDMIERFRKSLPTLQELSRDLNWIENEFSTRNSTEEERSQIKQIRNIACQPFDETAWRLERMFMPIKSKGTLFLNSVGRYQIKGTDKYFTCGDYCEVFLPYFEEEEDNYTWIPTSIESKNGEYCFVSRPNVPMGGALVRTRGY